MRGNNSNERSGATKSATRTSSRRRQSDTPQAPTALLFEIAWEVCTQIGGIYTVLRSKAPATARRWEDDYFMVGPYWEATSTLELEPQEPTGTMKEVIDVLSVGGMDLHFGRWLITGRPQVVLIDLSTVMHRLADIKYHLWKDNGVGSPEGDREFDEVVAFGFAATEFLMAYHRRIGERPMLAHFHEWQGGAAIPMIKSRGAGFSTVFTTHATMVGRNLSAANYELYENMHHIDGGAVARDHLFEHRHAIEGAIASSADIFTTVSGITAAEAEQFLGRRADALVPNGLNIERFSAPHEFQVLHKENKERIHQFTMGHFFPSYHFDLDKTLYVFTSGRYEFRNKGLDVFIEALYELNHRMRAERSDSTVVAFIITRVPYHALNVESLNRQAMFNELRETCLRVAEEMEERLIHTVATGRMPTMEDLLDEYGAVRLKRMMYALRHGTLPSIITHDVKDDEKDHVLRHLRHRGLWNREEDRVKVIFHPEFLSATSPLLSMDYDQFVHGCHLGVFPSYYEPWGYTPLECVVRGIPAITSDLSGFGSYVQENFPNHDENGIFVANRRGTGFGATVYQVADWMHRLTRMARRERIALRNRVENHADHFDWNNLARHYIEAQQLALESHYGKGEMIPPDIQIDSDVSDTTTVKTPRRRARTIRRRRR